LQAIIDLVKKILDAGYGDVDKLNSITLTIKKEKQLTEKEIDYIQSFYPNVESVKKTLDKARPKVKEIPKGKENEVVARQLKKVKKLQEKNLGDADTLNKIIQNLEDGLELDENEKEYCNDIIKEDKESQKPLKKHSKFIKGGIIGGVVITGIVIVVMLLPTIAQATQNLDFTDTLSILPIPDTEFVENYFPTNNTEYVDLKLLMPDDYLYKETYYREDETEKYVAGRLIQDEVIFQIVLSQNLDSDFAWNNYLTNKENIEDAQEIDDFESATCYQGQKTESLKVMRCIKNEQFYVSISGYENLDGPMKSILENIDRIFILELITP